MTQKALIQKLYIPLTVLLGMCILPIQTTIFRMSGIEFLQPELLLLIIIHLGLVRDHMEGAIGAYLLGYITEIHSGAPQGSIVLASLVVFSVAKILSKTIFIPNILSSIFLVMGLTVLWRLSISFGTSYLLGSMRLLPNTLLYLIPGVILHGLLTPPVFRILMKWDQLLDSKHTSHDGETIAR